MIEKSDLKYPQAIWIHADHYQETKESVYDIFILPCELQRPDPEVNEKF